MFPIRRAHQLGLRGFAAGDIQHDPPYTPGESAVVGHALGDNVGFLLLRLVRAADVAHGQELSAIVDGQDRAERHDALQAVGRHGRPGLAAVFRVRLVHGPAGALPREHEDPRRPRWINQTIDGRAVMHFQPVVGHRQQIAPCSAPVVAALEWTARPAVVDRPHAVHSLAVRHQQCGRVPLVHLVGAAGYGDVALGFAGEVNGRNPDQTIAGLGLVQRATARANRLRFVSRVGPFLLGKAGTSE